MFFPHFPSKRNRRRESPPSVLHQLNIVKERRAILISEDAILEMQRQRLGNHVLENLVHAHALLERDQREAHAVLVRAPGSADTVQVILIFSGQIKIDDCFHVVDVDAARRHVRRNQNGKFSAPEVVHDHIALALLHIAGARSAGRS